MFFTDLKTRLNVELRDSDNATFTDAEKVEALTKAIEEEAVAVVEESNATTFTNGTRNYGLGPNIRQIYSIGIDPSNQGNPYPLDKESYDWTAPNLTFQAPYVQGIPTNTVLYIKWLRKLTIADDIPAQVYPYVLNQAVYYTTRLLLAGKINRFLRNDTSVSEILNAGQAAKQDALRLKKSLPAARFVSI